jgi:hypothetical protein
VKPLTELRRRLTLRDIPGDEQRARAERWRPRAALAAVVAGCVGITGIAVAGAGNASPGVKFAQQGRYIYNSALGTIFHINGNTKNVDSQIPLPGAGPGTQVVESDQNAYVLAQGRTYEFGKSNLKVRDPQPAPLAERAIGLEAAGAAFAIYRQNGRIVRFNDHPAVAAIGVPLGQPVVTSTGTVWVHRPDNGQLCHLPLDADRLACPAKVPLGHTGALTVVGGDQVVFVDTTSRDMYAVDDGGRTARYRDHRLERRGRTGGDRRPAAEPAAPGRHRPADRRQGRRGAGPQAVAQGQVRADRLVGQHHRADRRQHRHARHA